MNNLTPFEVGFGAAWALDARKKAHRNAVYAQAEAASAWHAQTGVMTAEGYNAIVQANYLRSQEPKPMGNVGMFFTVLIIGPLILLGWVMIAMFVYFCLADIVRHIL